MAFRANESAVSGYERAQRYLISREMGGDDRERASRCLEELVERLGPVVDSYPTWHPLVANHDPRCPETTPSERCGYRGLDHTIYFRNGFITCPYHGGQAVLDSVNELPPDEIVSINAEWLETPLYSPSATPVLVTCEWHRPMAMDGTVPEAVAVPMILEREVPCWRWAERGETWESMRPYLLGGPCGSRSSLFINQDTGSTIRKIWRAIVETGAFGPIKVARH